MGTEERTEHIWILLLCLAAIAGAFALEPTAEGPLVLPLSFDGVKVQIPETCASRRILGVSCPGCGLTRSFVFTARGELRQAVKANAMGPMLFCLCWLQIPYRLVRYLGWGTRYRMHPIVRAIRVLVTWGLLGGLMVTWVVTLIGV